MQLTTHFSLNEMNPHGNVLDQQIQDHLKDLCFELEMIRRFCGNRPITITSGYRSKKHNEAIGGSKTSDHTKGMACDFKVQDLSPKAVCEILIPVMEFVEFDQLIIYPGHVHLGHRGVNRNRRQLLWK